MDDQNKRKTGYLAVSIIFIVGAVFFALFAMGYYLKLDRTAKNITALRDEEREDEEPKKEIWNGIEIPSLDLDWAGLKFKNQDIFAYLYIPGTRVDAPVLQRAGEDSYYASHDEYGEENSEGSLYLTASGTKDFSGQNTVVYGRESSDGSLLGTLSYYQDADFFDRSPCFFVYTPAKTWIFQVFAAYRYGELPLRDTFSDASDFNDYLDQILSQKDLNSHFLRDTKVKLNGDAHIVSLVSLDEGGEPSYIVQGILLDR
ncbi:MAG: class B sortase [Lachnospiraceae bacterium]|nr:class B sortase [Lachnospiraceae bacterium]